MILLPCRITRLLVFAAAILVAATGQSTRAQNPDEFEDVEMDGAAPAVPQPVFNNGQPTAEQFEQWVFNRAGGSGAARNRLNANLSLHIDAVDRACSITSTQKKKLELAGRGDIKRFFDRVEEAKRRFRLTRNDQNNNFWMEISPLQVALNVGLFGEESIFAKTIKNTLNEDQAARFAQLQAERKRSRFRNTSEWWVIQMDRTLGLSDRQRRRLADVIFAEGRPPRRFGQGDYWYIMLQASLISEDKIKPIFDEVQWRLLTNEFNQARGMRQWLKQNGMMPEEPPAGGGGGGMAAALPADVFTPAAAAGQAAKKNDKPAEKKKPGP